MSKVLSSKPFSPIQKRKTDKFFLTNLKEFLIKQIGIHNENRIVIDERLKSEYLNTLPIADNLYDYMNDIMNISYSNINVSLDIINGLNKNLVDDYVLIPRKKKLIFNNISVFNLKKDFKKIIEDMCTVKKTLFGNSSILEEVDNTRSDASSKIDFYLKDYHSTPYSSNSNYNMIYILRQFPFFKILFGQYLKICKDEEILSKIYDNDLETLSDVSSYDTAENSFLPSMFPNNLDVVINNIMNIDNDNAVISDYTFVLDMDGLQIDLDDIIFKIDQFKKYCITFGIYKMENSDYYHLLKIFDMNESFISLTGINETFLLHNVLAIYFVLLSEPYTKETMPYHISNFLINSYYLYSYYENVFNKGFRIIFKNDSNDIVDLNIFNAYNQSINTLDTYINKSLYNMKLFTLIAAKYIYDSAYTFKEKIRTEIERIKHLLYVSRYIKSQEKKFYPLFTFLIASNTNRKIFKEYSDNELLDLLIDVHDKIYNTSNTVVIKK